MEQPNTRRRRRSHRADGQKTGKKSPETLSARLTRVVVVILASLLGLGLLLGAFLGGRASVSTGERQASSPSDRIAASPSPQITEDQIALFDQVFELINGDDHPAAEQLLRSALEEEPDLPFATYLLAELLIAQRKDMSALPLLHRAMERGEAPLYTRLAIARLVATSPQGIQAANGYYRQAMQVDPIASEPFFQYGKALRIEGRANEAIVRLRAALHRAKSDSERPVIETMLILARLEVGDAGMAKELQSVEEAESPRGSLLVGAAGLAMQEKDFARAARLLEKARAALPHSMFNQLTADQFFDLHREKPELRDFLPQARQIRAGS